MDLQYVCYPLLFSLCHERKIFFNSDFFENKFSLEKERKPKKKYKFDVNEKYLVREYNTSMLSVFS